jgi:DNA-binding MarR family transcriptional regulator
VADRGPLRIGEVAEAEHVSAPTATRLVAGLENRGLLEREVDPDDRRSSLVQATPAGVKVLGAAREVATAALSDRLAALAPAERDAIVAALPALERLTGAS